jgi:hypothetical protein
MQDETQMATATSSPDPLAADGPGDRDIDVLALLPDPVGCLVAGKINQLYFVRVHRMFVDLVDFVSASSPALQRWARHATNKVEGLEEPGRMIMWAA